ncbi:hypothetical protein AK812_SmicGene19547 [Symbiodinium microadriaticum]|uniref:Uncharacterized protein n=1 Tax=Symbiodinium microadriaticum TaxID=2951 RepID=A0A1Q9DSA4_SYMMI|nr:hypothetical protein AK812_SmicGene19547 [Symbiodinium microadriaticum]
MDPGLCILAAKLWGGGELWEEGRGLLAREFKWSKAGNREGVGGVAGVARNKQAINASARFDEAFSLQLSADKCFLVAKEHDDCTRRLADTHDFKVGSTLDLLGVSFSGLELCSFALPGPSQQKAGAQKLDAATFRVAVTSGATGIAAFLDLALSRGGLRQLKARALVCGRLGSLGPFVPCWCVWLLDLAGLEEGALCGFTDYNCYFFEAKRRLVAEQIKMDDKVKERRQKRWSSPRPVPAHGEKCFVELSLWVGGGEAGEVELRSCSRDPAQLDLLLQLLLVEPGLHYATNWKGLIWQKAPKEVASELYLETFDLQKDVSFPQATLIDGDVYKHARTNWKGWALSYPPVPRMCSHVLGSGWTDEAQQLLLRWFAAPKKGAKKHLAIQDAEQPASSKKRAIQDVEQPSSSETLASKDVEQRATEDVENPPEAAVDTNADECTSSSSSSSSSSSALPVVDTMGWDSQWHDIWQQTTALDRRCSGSKKRSQTLKSLLKSIYVAERGFEEPDFDSS